MGSVRNGQDGLTTIPSSFGPKETTDRLEAEIKGKGMTVFARIDHAAGAAELGLPLRPTELLIFGSAKAGTPLMQANQAIGIDLPLKALVFEDAAGKVMGRFLHDETDAYLTTDRSGRGRALSPEQRRAILDVYLWYHHALLNRGFVEHAEFVRMAYWLRLNGEQTQADYAAVIVDEVQDISEIAVRLLHSLVGDRADGLLLVGDATQRIFTRGYTLRGLGIDIAGRGLVLRKNYRNTKADIGSRLSTYRK
jgi:uncharacterized protein (DUF302 family)